MFHPLAFAFDQAICNGLGMSFLSASNPNPNLNHSTPSNISFNNNSFKVYFLLFYFIFYFFFFLAVGALQKLNRAATLESLQYDNV